MPAAITTNINEQLGTPLGSLLLTLAAQEWSGVPVARLVTWVDFYALDGTNTPFAFQYSLTLAGTYVIVPAGSMVTLPFYGTMSYFFKWVTSASTVYGITSG